MSGCFCSTVSEIKAKNDACLTRGSKGRDNPLTTTFSEGDSSKMYNGVCHLGLVTFHEKDTVAFLSDEHLSAILNIQRN